MTTRATIQETHSNTTRLDFEPDELLDGRAPIEMMQHKPIFYFAFYIEALMYARGKTFLMSSNIPVRPYSDDLRISLAPDIFFAYVEDVTPFLHETGYNIWQVGKPPDLVLEVASRSTYRKDVNEKPAIYASMGIPEYWMFDPTGGELYGQALIGYRLVDGEYVPIEMTRNEHGILSGYSDVWRMRLCSMERWQRGEILSRQPHFVFYEQAYPAELLLQDPETGLYILNGMGISAQYRAGMAELDAAINNRDTAVVERDAVVAERDAAIAERNATVVERDARIRELEEEIRRLRS